MWVWVLVKKEIGRRCEDVKRTRVVMTRFFFVSPRALESEIYMNTIHQENIPHRYKAGSLRGEFVRCWLQRSS
jgi:hypothetical protein